MFIISLPCAKVFHVISWSEEVLASVVEGEELLLCLFTAVFQVQPYPVQKLIITGVTEAETFL